MSIIINKNFTFIKYLGNTRNISSLPNYSQIKTIFRANGDSFELWDSDNNEFFNAFSELITNEYYFIISKNSNPNFVLYEENDVEHTQETQINSLVRFYEFKCPEIEISTMLDKMDLVFKVSDDGQSFDFWDHSTDIFFNTILTFKQNQIYLIFSKDNKIPYDLCQIPTPTPTPASSNLRLCDRTYINNSQIFDKTSWNQPTNISIEKWPKWKQYLDKSADRWANYINFDSQVFQSIKNIDSIWNGIKLNSIQIYNDPSSGTIAACGPYEYVDIMTNQAGVKFNTYSFDIYINEYYENVFDDCDWVNVLTHELGHALGIGVYWDSFFEPQGAVVPINNFLSGASYQNSQTAYNQITNLSRNFVPLEDYGSQGTVGSHWEMDYRSINAEGYPGFSDELMIGYYSQGSNFVISSLSIKSLVDFGYIEINPGNNEGNPSLVNNTSMLASNLGIKLNCFSIPKPKRVAVLNI